MPKRLEAEFECSRESVRAAREFLAVTMASWDCDDEEQVAALLTTEIVTNAIVHAGTAYRLAVELVPPELMVEVFDGDPTLPVRMAAAAHAESGRGLALLEAMAARWGARAHSGGKAVWFALACVDGRRIGLPSPGTS